MEIETVKLGIGNGGWVRWAPAGIPPLFVRATIEDQRATIADVFVPLDGLDSRQWRRIGQELTRVEAIINDPDTLDDIRRRLNLPGPLLRTAVTYSSTTFGSQAPKTWVTRMLASQLDGSDEPEVQPVDGELEANGVQSTTVEVPEIEIPTTRPYPDEFYRQIAEIYTELATYTRRPAAVMAEESGIPVKTIHRWVAAARDRGHLPPARPGKAG